MPAKPGTSEVEEDTLDKGDDMIPNDHMNPEGSADDLIGEAFDGSVGALTPEQSYSDTHYASANMGSEMSNDKVTATEPQRMAVQTHDISAVSSPAQPSVAFIVEEHSVPVNVVRTLNNNIDAGTHPQTPSPILASIDVEPLSTPTCVDVEVADKQMDAPNINAATKPISTNSADNGSTAGPASQEVPPSNPAQNDVSSEPVQDSQAVPPPEGTTGTADLNKPRDSPTLPDSPKKKPRYLIKEVAEDDQVWQKDLQDRELADIYVKLNPRNPAKLIPFDNPPEDPNSLIEFSDWGVMAKEPVQTKALIKKCLEFDSHGKYVNPARVDVEKLLVPESKGPNIPLYMTLAAKPTEQVIFISTGMILKNCLHSGKLSGANGPKPYQIKKTYLTHHIQEFEAAVGCFGTVFDFESMGSDFYDMSVGFSTQRYYPGTGGNSYASQKKKVPAQLKQKSNKLGRSSAAGIPAASRQFKSMLGFFDHVPQYDARNIENFSLDLWVEKLGDLPLYAKGEEDIPNGSAVALGYTVARSPARGHMAENLFMNVMWVILLGLPVEDEESENE